VQEFAQEQEVAQAQVWLKNCTAKTAPSGTLSHVYMTETQRVVVPLLCVHSGEHHQLTDAPSSLELASLGLQLGT